MCEVPFKRSSSFTIDDILTVNKKVKSDVMNNNNKSKTNNNKTNMYDKYKTVDTKEYYENNYYKQNGKINKTNNKKEETIKAKENYELLRMTLLHNTKDKYVNLVPEDLSKSAEVERQRNTMLGHNDGTSAFRGVESSSTKSSVSSRIPIPAAYGYPGCASQMDLYGASFGNGVSQTNHWPLLSNLYNYSTHPHTSYPPYFSPSYLRPYPLPLSLSFPLPYSKRKGGQVRFTPQQTQNLERRFGSHQYLSPEDRRILADQLKLTDRQVKTWFQNRRAKWRRTKNLSTSDSRDESETHSDDDIISSASNESAMFRSPANSPISVG